MNAKHVIGLTIIAVSMPAFAKTDVPAAMGQLKVNEENAKGNRKQYDDNVEIATKNVVEVTAAIKQLREQRARMSGSSQSLEKNLAILDTVKAKLIGFKAEETAAQKKEDMQVAQIKGLLEKLEANKAKRQQNLAAYDQKLAEVETERGDWSMQKQSFGSIQKELDQKEAKASAERDQWIAKRNGYRDESAKWDKEAKAAEEQRIKYEKLKD